MSFGINDISSIKVKIQPNDQYITGYFSSVASAYRALRSWYAVAYQHHGQSMPITLSFAVDAQEVEGEYQEAAINQSHLSYGDFITWVSSLISDMGELASVRVNRPAHIHVSWDYLHHFLVIQRPPIKAKGILKPLLSRPHHFTVGVNGGKAALIRLLEGYAWTFKFQDTDGTWHYYSDDTASIHSSLLRAAVENDTFHLTSYVLPQTDALYGLQQFYKQHPTCLSSLSSYYIEQLVHLIKPGHRLSVSKEAYRIIVMIGTQATPFVQTAITEIEQWVRDMRSLFSDDVSESDLADISGSALPPNS